MKRQRKTMLILTLIFVTIQLFTYIGFTINNKRDYMYEVIVIIVLLLIFTIIEIKYNLYLHNYTRAVVFIIVISHVLVGEYFNIYAKSFTFDKALHFLGTYSFSLFTYSLFIGLTKKTVTSKLNEFIFITLLGISLGTFYETIEFIIDIIFKPTIPAQNGLLDTNLDIIFNILGAFTSSLHMILTHFKLIKSKVNY